MLRGRTTGKRPGRTAVDPVPAPPPLGRRFALVWASVTISALGDGMRFVALPLLASRLTSDPRQIAAVALAEQLPWLVIGLPSGALADRVDRRRVLWVTDSCRALVAAVLAVAVATGRDSVALLVGSGIPLGCGQALYNGAWAGIVPALVPRSQFARANARILAGVLTAETLLGTLLGAVVFGAAASLPFFVDSGSFGAAAGLALLVGGSFRPRGGAGDPEGPEPEPETGGPRGTGEAAADTGTPSAGRTLRQDVAEGVRWLLRHPTLRLLCAVAGLLNLANGGMVAILVVYARQAVGLGSVGFALLVAGYAVGGLGGTAGAARLTGRFGPTRVLPCAMAVAVAAIAVVSGARSAAIAAVAIAVFGAADLLWNVTAVSLRQSLVPHAMLGRVTMAYQLVTNASGALGALGAGYLAHGLGVRAPFWCAALVLGAATVIQLPLRGAQFATSGTRSE
ncbi:Predicted arabinose efflux permease, MFS family [Actinacidiphila yanglinensis]|uniref:Predicted arabinose efflux permease, MFS family n=1 Tax=Actinacidiphila yanglinensis TaxID=310779 RepID=A0A1H5YXY6_9ACTN|nr:MFS transporter [Actinacidiphila yanglinensis]SEG28712.1 Predicted arabinose efflux permease, MFS family [Actinacidiphila yanglinensis]